MYGVNWDMVQTVVAVGSFFLAMAASVYTWRMHKIDKTNQDVQQHKIGDLTEKEMRLLGPEHRRDVWAVLGDKYVRCLLGRESAVIPFDEDGCGLEGDMFEARKPFGESLPIAGYDDAMERLVLYGLVEVSEREQWFEYPYGSKVFAYAITTYGEIVHRRQQRCDRRENAE